MWNSALGSWALTLRKARMARSSVAASVTPVPRESVMVILRVADSSSICWLMPWTSTSLMPRLRRTAMSMSRLLKFSSATMEPSRAMTKICPWNRGTYLRMPRRSVGLMMVVAGPLLIGMAWGFSSNRAPASMGDYGRGETGKRKDRTVRQRQPNACESGPSL